MKSTTRIMEVDQSKCLICEVSCHQKGLTFFRFPKEESRLKMWIKEISPLLDILKIHRNSLKENGRICARHFREKDFINCKRNSLVRNACPSLSISNLSINIQKENKGNEVVFEQKGFSGGDQTNDASDKDIFQCGRCKTQFAMLSEFMDHKRYQCRPANAKSTKTSPQRNRPVQPNGLLPLETVFGSDVRPKECSQPESQTSPSERVLKIMGEDDQKIVSLVVSDNKLLMDERFDITGFPTQILMPQVPLWYNGMVIGNPVDLSLAGQVVVSPPNPLHGSVLLSNVDGEAQVSSLILAVDDENCSNVDSVYAGSTENSKGLVVASGPALATEMPDSSKSVTDSDDHVTYCELTNAIRNPQETSSLDLPREEAIGPTEIEFERTKTKLPCTYCGKVFEKPFNLQQHERVHTGERPFQCIVCGRAFTQKSNVRKHMMRHRVWPKGKQTLKLRGLNEELANGESLDKIDYSCQYCSLSFKSYGEHKKHLAVHSNIKVYRCIQRNCNETFGDLDEFLSHSKMHSSAEFQCHICLKVYTNLEELGIHQYDHDTTGKERKRETGIKLKCKVCHARFKTTESLKNHLAVDTHNYECIHCKSVFCSERFLRRHLFIHVDSSHSRFKCPNCKKTFRTQQNLKNHMFIHLKEKPFTCDHCYKQFASKYRLKRHLAIHLSQHLECPFKKHLGCSKTFYRKDKLRDHVDAHGRCKLRSCRICSKMYRSLSKLHRHTKRDHKAVKFKGKEGLKCLACAETFRKHKQLTQHRCTAEEKSRIRERGSVSGEKTAVSNIEIIMVPFGTGGGNLT